MTNNAFKVRKGLIVNGSGSTVLDILGSQGELFSVTDDLSGSLFSVNDISGIPIMEVFSDDTINMGTFGAEAIVVSGSHTTTKDVYVSGSVGIGTTAPSTPLEISSSLQTGHLRLSNDGGYTDFVQYTVGDLNINPSSNLVGININPSYPLHLYHPSIINVAQIESGNNRAYVRMVNDDTTGVTSFGADRDDFELIADKGNIIFTTATDGNDQERMRVTDGGNVGIGTSSPSNLLHVNSGISDAPARFQSSDDLIRIALEDGSDVAYLGHSGTSGIAFWGYYPDVDSRNLSIDTSGNVGIGTTAPSEALTVQGNISGSSLLTLTPQDPLPAGASPGSFAVSGSTPPKPYFWDGNAWNALY